MNKTRIRLSDGRQLTYYDSSADTRREAADGRRLSAANSYSELRRDPFLGAWVIYATHRQDRSYLPAAVECPLCPSRGGHRTEIPAADYEVVVFENRFPALTPSPGAELAVQGGLRDGLLTARSSAGGCEVVCYTSDHEASFAELSHDRVSLVLEALIDRTAELAAQPGVEQVYCFENRGREIGVTQPHPHGQIYAYPFVTPRTERVLASVQAHFRHTGRNLFDDVIAAERVDGSRIVLATQHWTAFVPHAARWPYEVHCYPNRRVPELASLSPDERHELADVQLDLLGRFSRLFPDPAPYIAAWHQAPVRRGRQHFALHLELFTVRRTGDKLKYLAGSESGMGTFANDIIPEAAACRLRELSR